jgi:AmmeMemoRadiSam system protein B/AmmeMemoRadiSam system protein A
MQATAVIRPAAVAGAFYPAAPEPLRAGVRHYLEEARPHASGPVPKALIVPHAGYVYSGPVAASAYARLVPLRGIVRRVVLLGPTHRVAVRGLALPGVDAFATPLGQVPMDVAAVAAIADLPQVLVSQEAHAREHSLEVHLPFLQEVLGDFALLPLAVGRVPPKAVAEVLERVWGGPETLVLISSDLSHYHPYPMARHEDRGTVQDMLALRTDIDHEHACGATPVNGLLLVARRKGLRPRLLDLRNSGDTAGDKSRVVGYASIAFHEPHPGEAGAPGAGRGEVLLRIARATIGRQLGVPLSAREEAPFLAEQRASFVTLKAGGRLRGCIGSLAAYQPLLDDVKKNARAAAFQDPRFKSLTMPEFDAVSVEVSLLSPQAPLSFASQQELLSQLRPGIDGLVLSHGTQRGTFLPQVWETLPRPEDFLAQLKRKAGLPTDFWADGIAVSRYTVEKWSEPG